MTLSKLARLANVSVSVVSKAFSGKDGVSDAMREHVFTVAREHGCFEQFYHAPYDKPVVAVIIPEAISVYYIHYIEVLKKSMEANGYTMLLSISNFDSEMTEELVRYYTEHGKVNAIIVLFGGYPDLKKKSDTAIITLSDSSFAERPSTVRFDLSSGISKALAHLVSLGHRRIAYIGEPLTSEKCSIIKKHMEELGLEVSPELMIESRARFEEAGRDGISRLLALSDRPTAVFGAYGYITKGIMKELEADGIKIPDDISVISMDNDPGDLHHTLNVSCIPSGIEASCEGIMATLHRAIDLRESVETLTITVQSEFHVGDTVAKISQ